jgi:hypothetical protein
MRRRVSVSIFCVMPGTMELVGDLRVPSDDPGHGWPAVVLTGPFTGVKEQVTGSYAELLRARGFVTLAFDHRGFGESGGYANRAAAADHRVEAVAGIAGGYNSPSQMLSALRNLRESGDPLEQNRTVTRRVLDRVSLPSRQQVGECVVYVLAVPRPGDQAGRVSRVTAEDVQPAVVAGEDQVATCFGSLGRPLRDVPGDGD